MKSPPNNKSDAAIRLRQAAVTFADYASAPVNNDHDTNGCRNNRGLLAAALQYAATVLEDQTDLMNSKDGGGADLAVERLTDIARRLRPTRRSS